MMGAWQADPVVMETVISVVFCGQEEAKRRRLHKTAKGDERGDARRPQAETKSGHLQFLQLAFLRRGLALFFLRHVDAATNKHPRCRRTDTARPKQKQTRCKTSVECEIPALHSEI